MQIFITFEDGEELGAIQLARLLLDLQHLTVALTNYPINSRGVDVDLTIPFNPKYESMVIADHSGGFVSKKSTAEIVSIQKQSPLDVVIAVFCSVSALGGVAATAKLVSRIILDLQKIRKARLSGDREALRLVKERLLLEKEYLKIRKSLPSEIERKTLDSNMAHAMEALVDGRHPKIARMGARLLHPPK